MLLIGLLSSGCTTLLPGSSYLPLHGQYTPLPPGPICRVAVLPFINESPFPLGEAIVTKVFSAQLQEAGNYQVIQDGDIFNTYQQLRILPDRIPSDDQFLIIAGRFKSQLLITGRILEMEEGRGFAGAVNPMLFVEIQISDGSSGEKLWTTLHRRQGTDYHTVMHFGIIQTLTGLSKQMAVEIINHWNKKGQIQCDALSQS